MSAESEVRTIVENWAKAISVGDRAAILANHSSDLLMFDFPGTVEGLDAYDKTWDFFFADPLGPISFVPREIAVSASDSIAFVSCMVHCEGTSAGPVDLRLITGLRRVGADWVIVHGHHSVPTKEERLTGPNSACPDEAGASGINCRPIRNTVVNLGTGQMTQVIRWDADLYLGRSLNSP